MVVRLGRDLLFMERVAAREVKLNGAFLFEGVCGLYPQDG